MGWIVALVMSVPIPLWVFVSGVLLLIWIVADIKMRKEANEDLVVDLHHVAGLVLAVATALSGFVWLFLTHTLWTSS